MEVNKKIGIIMINECIKETEENIKKIESYNLNKITKILFPKKSKECEKFYTNKLIEEKIELIRLKKLLNTIINDG